MTSNTKADAIVGPMQSGPGARRPVEVDGWVVGIAESREGVEAILERAGLPDDAVVEWIGGDETAWE